MSEAELHLLRARLRGGLLNKARRGELGGPLPVGLIYDPAASSSIPIGTSKPACACSSRHSSAPAPPMPP
jgi:DNA invertase Pin-like site-specific DNA recombinase